MPQKWSQSHFSIDSIPKHILDIYIHILDCGVTRKIVLKRYKLLGASQVAQLAKNPPARKETLVGKIPWRRERLPTPVLWPGECHGLCSSRGRKESDTTERLSLSLYKLLVKTGD